MDRTCSRCRRSLPVSEFYPRTAKCKSCTREQVRANRRLKVEHYRAYDRERYQQPERRESVNAALRRRSSDPERAAKVAARIAVGNALRDGRLRRGSCEICGNHDVEAHHEDYTRPLEVRWLCFVHHRREHGQFQETTKGIPF